MAITKPPVLPAWAESGDKVTPSNAEIQVGWPLSSIPPSRQRFNWLLNFLANGIRYFSRRGLPDYDAAETYMTGDRIIGDDGKTYRSLIDNNTAQTPSTSPTKWEEWAPSLSRLADLLQKQTYTAFTTAGAAPNFTLTPAPAITAYAAGQRFRVKFHAAGNGADVLNISGIGNKSLKQYDSTGAKVAAVIAAGQLADVEYDGVDMVLIDPLPSAPVVVPSGSVIYVAQNTAPSGYLKANGAAVSRSAYSALFAALVTNAGFTSQNFTVTIATPGVFTKAAHGFVGGERLRLSTTGALPTGLNNSTDYFVEVIGANTFYLNTSPFVGGTRVATSGAQSGTHSYLQSWFGLGDGSTTFLLPDLRGEFLRGFDDSRGVDTQHAFGSNQKGSFANLGAGPAADCSTTFTTVTGNLARYDLGYDQPSVADYPNALNKYISPTGSSAPADADTSYGTSRPRNVSMLACIKY